MKSSQSNFNLWSPDCYWVRSYLVSYWRGTKDKRNAFEGSQYTTPININNICTLVDEDFWIRAWYNLML